MFTVALLQMASAGFDQAANQAKGEVFCRGAQAMGADVALFPEMWNIGYKLYEMGKPETLEAFLSQAIPIHSPFVAHYRRLARELDMAIGLTFLEQWPKAPRNTLALIDRRGEIVLIYSKVHTCDFDQESALTPGEEFFVCDLDTAGGLVKVGVMICFDREFPESARILMLKGAEIILVPNACEMERHRTGQLNARAYENMVGVALANYAAPQEKGHSVAFHPMAFDQNGSVDTLVVEAGEAEGVYLAAFDMERIRDYRAREVWGNAYRRRQCYGLLTSLEVAEPFKRLKPDGSPYDPLKR